MTHSGSCLCAAISFTVEGALRNVLHCHCVNCQKSSGNYVAATSCELANLTVADPTSLLRWYDLGYAQYGFCATCGSRLFWQGTEHPDQISIQVGCLDDGPELPLEAVWFANDAHHHVPVNHNVAQHVGNGGEYG